MKATLVLEDGKSFSGEAISGSGERVGEVICNTAVVGYQEMLTDPANYAKILVLTYPLIGNYGIAPKFNESARVWLSGLVIKEKSRIYSNWQAKSSLDSFIKEHGLLTLAGIDTRTLAMHLRQKGSMLGIISTNNSEPKALLARLESFRKATKKSVLSEISVSKPRVLGKPKTKFKIAVLDLGVQNSLLRQLETLGASIYLLPFNTTAGDMMRIKPKGLIISNGPEEDASLNSVVENIRPLIKRLPIMGISTGHQVLARALGAKLIRLKSGHRGVNYPIQNPASYKGEITVQNHGLVVDQDSLAKIKELKITAYNLNDRTVEEMESKNLKLLGVQYYPASPGLNEINPVFNKFLKMMKKE
jgi:carbamoyl-phosphate synthase small subunit